MTLRLNNNNGNSASIDYVDGVSTDVDIEFPELSGTVALQGANGGLGGNISAATIFRLNSNFSTGNGVVTGWEAPDQAGESAGVGGAVTESNGVFTFPATGIWLIVFTSRANIVGGVTISEILTRYSSDSGDSFSTIASAVAGNNNDDNDLTQTISSYAIVNINNINNRRINFRSSNLVNGSSISGSSTLNRTTALFLRLGDT